MWRNFASFGTVLATTGFLSRKKDKTHYKVADLPDASKNEGMSLYVQDGAAGSPVLAFSDGTNWLRSDTLAAVAAA